MKNKKGFTLVELLAVIVLLGILVAIAVPSVLGISKKIKENMYEAKVKTIEVAAEAWADDNKNSCKTLNDKSIGFLISEGYLKADDKEGNIKNPVDNSEIKGKQISDYINIVSLCKGMPTIVNSYNVTRATANKVQGEINKYFEQKNVNKTCIDKKSKTGNKYLLSEVAECISSYNKDEFEFLLDDGSKVEDYGVYFATTPGEGAYSVKRYQYEYKIDLYKDNIKYQTITTKVDINNLPKAINVTIPAGYKFNSTTCSEIQRSYNSNFTFTASDVSNTYYTNKICSIYFVPDIATKNY